MLPIVSYLLYLPIVSTYCMYNTVSVDRLIALVGELYLYLHLYSAYKVLGCFHTYCLPLLAY